MRNQLRMFWQMGLPWKRSDELPTRSIKLITFPGFVILAFFKREIFLSFDRTFLCVYEYVLSIEAIDSERSHAAFILVEIEDQILQLIPPQKLACRMYCRTRSRYNVKLKSIGFGNTHMFL